MNSVLKFSVLFIILFLHACEDKTSFEEKREVKKTSMNDGSEAKDENATAKISVKPIQNNADVAEPNVQDSNASQSSENDAEVAKSSDKDGIPSESLENVQKPSQEEIAKCSAKLGIQEDRIKVAGNGSLVTLNSQTGLFLKVTGSNNEVVVSFDKEQSNVAGGCIEVEGNNNSVRLFVADGVNISKLYIVVRGNESRVYVPTVIKKDVLIADLKGKNTQVINYSP